MDRWIGRRDFLTKAWKWCAGVVAGAGAWTSWDVLDPRDGLGSSGPMRTVSTSDVPRDAVIEVAAVRGYLTSHDGEVVALSWKCPHLGCKVPWCDSSGQFECPCHGSVFNRLGEYRRGPAPRGMDRLAVEVADGVALVDVGTVTLGDPPSVESIDEPPKGPECLEE